MTGASQRVRSPARLHLGFIDLNGGLGRRFGSVGLAIHGLDADVVAEATPGTALEVTGFDTARARDAARRTLDWMGVAGGARIDVGGAAPAHAGLGSGTQIALAVAAAVAAAYGRGTAPRELAAVVGRGRRSGIGIGAFATGGFLVDGGRGDADRIAPVVARLPFPAAWRAVLIFDDAHHGLHGAAERQAFAVAAPMREDDAAQLARWCLLGLLPAVIEEDFPAFTRALVEVQARNGAYFAPYQGGTAYTSARVAAAVSDIARRFGLTAAGQSSWGPTGFVFVPSPALADEVCAFATACAGTGTPLRFQVVAGCNEGARVTAAESRDHHARG